MTAILALWAIMATGWALAASWHLYAAKAPPSGPTPHEIAARKAAATKARRRVEEMRRNRMALEASMRRDLDSSLNRGAQ